MSTRGTHQRENAAVAERIWSATAAGDARALADVLDENVVWRAHGHNPLAGTFRGRDRVIAYFADFADRVDDVRLSLQDVYASGDGAVIAYEVEAQQGGRTYRSETLIRLRIRDGRVAEADVTPLDQAVADAFFNWIH